MRCAACLARQERRLRGGDRADFGGEIPRASRQFDFVAQRRRRRIHGEDYGGEASRGRRFDSGSQRWRRGTGRAHCRGGAHKSSGRSIPAEVKREDWRRDIGCCTYVDPHTGRRCGSRFFLELDHIVPVARGGAGRRRGAGEF